MNKGVLVLVGKLFNKYKEIQLYVGLGKFEKMQLGFFVTRFKVIRF